MLSSQAHLVPWLAAVISLASFSVSLFSLRIARQQAAEREAELSIYIQDICYYQQEAKKRLYAWTLTFTNPGSASVSIAQVRMTVRARFANHLVQMLFFEPSPREAGCSEYRLEPFDTKTFNFRFDVDMSPLSNDVVFSEHILECRDSRGRTINASPAFVPRRSS